MNLDDLTAAQRPPIYRAAGPSMHDVAMALHRIRRDHGLAKYSSPLQTHNGRSADIDRLQESLDGLVYEIQRTVEAEALRVALADFSVRMRAHARTGDEASSVEDAYDELLNPAALAVRADAIAAELLQQAWERR